MLVIFLGHCYDYDEFTFHHCQFMNNMIVTLVRIAPTNLNVSFMKVFCVQDAQRFYYFAEVIQF